MIHTNHSVCPYRTLPLQGVKHMTSPSLPSAILSKEHLPQLPYHPVLQNYAEPFLSGTLHDIGPSARLLVVKNQSKKATYAGKTKSVKINDFEDRKVDEKGTNQSSVSKKERDNNTEKNMEVDAAAAEAKLSLSNTKGSSTNQNSSLGPFKMSKVTSRVLEMSKTLNQTYTKTTPVSLMNRTMPHNNAPPLATALEEYVQREMRATLNGVDGYSTAQDRLGPFREAFLAFIDSFPGYSNILNDILVAYDSVIQEQAGMLVSIITSQSEQHLNEEQMRQEVFTLTRRVTELTDELDDMRASLVEKEEGQGKLSNDDHRQRAQRARTSSAEKNKKLAAAKERITALEETNKSDLEKILVLINAVRESDRRVKTLEHDLAVVTAQVEELDDFKRMAGDAQTELEEFKVKFRNFISVQDHDSVKEQLTNELNAAHNMARHYRRAVAVRGTQVDVIGRKLALLQEEKLRLVDAAKEESSSVLTPRPEWKKVYAVLQDVKENADPIDALPLEGDEGATARVEGLKETALHVEYLVERIQSLSRELKKRPLTLPAPPVFDLPLVALGTDTKIPLHLRACGVIPRVKLDPIEMIVFAHDFFRDVLRPHPDALLPTLDISTLFLDFARERIKTKESLKCFTFPEHLAMNIVEDVKDSTRCRPSLVLLSGILSGIYPARLGCDAITVLENVRSELSALASAQKKSRLRRTAISECISPVLHLRTEKDIDALKDAMGPDSTFDVVALNSTTSRFMSLLLDQECALGMVFYVKILEKLTSYSYFVDQKDGGMVIRLDNVGIAILEVEPLTPQSIIKEITDLSDGALEGTEDRIVHLSSAVRLLATAPIIRRRSPQKYDKGVL